MRLSNKSTFSLASLILLLALGVIFGTTFVMAHAPDDATVGPHTHPVTEEVAADASATPPVLPVPIHNAHPSPVITLKSGQTNVRGNMIALDATTNTTFTLVVDYGMDVTGAADNTDTSGVLDTDLSIGADDHATLQVDNNAAADAGFAITRVVGDASMFEVVVTPGLYPNADTAATATNDDTLTFRIQLPAGGLFSLQTTEIGTGVDPVTVPGGASLASALSVFTLVDALETITTPDTTAPSFTVVTTPADDTALTAGDPVQFTLTATEELGTGNNELLATNVEGTTNVTSMSFVRVSNTQYVVIVTPTDHTKPIVITIAADAVFDTADTPNGNAEQTFTFTPADTVAPTVTITSAAGTGTDADKVVFTFTFSEAVQDFTEDDLIRSTGVTLAGNLESDDNTVFTVLVNLAPAGSPTSLTLRAGAVTDGANRSVGDKLHTYVAPDEPDPDPVDPMDPTSPANISGQITIPAESYVILVRDKAATIGNNPPLGQRFDGILDLNNNRVIPDAKIMEWSGMPDLAELFDRGATGGGGALVLRKAVGDTAAPAVGTVGISEIMWAIDAGYIGQTRARDSQWIELHNLNTTAKTVLIYAQTGAQFTNNNRIVVDTQAGDRLYGKLGEANETKMVVDVMTNYFNGSDRGTEGWDIPGSNGSSKVGIDFVSMARIPKRDEFNLTRRHEDKNDKPLDGLYNNAKGAENSLDGRSSGSWAAATVSYHTDATDNPDAATTNVPTTYDYLGTPGRPNTHKAASHITKDGRTSVPANSVIINEVANRSDARYEWIELRNLTDSEVNIRNYMISVVTSNSSDKPLIQLPANNNAKIAPQGVLLLVASDPRNNPDHPLAVGWNVDLDPEDQARGLAEIGITKTSKHGRYKVVDFEGGGLPDGDSQKFVLILRRKDNDEGQRSGADGGKGVAETGNADLDKILDIGGYDNNLSKSGYSNAVSSTNLWPLRNFEGPASNKNRFLLDRVIRRQHVSADGGKSGVGTTHGDKNQGQVAFGPTGYTGIGYKRQAADSSVHGGDPGYDGVTRNSAHDSDGGPRVYISEIMLSQGSERTKLPQWIELYNASDYAINLAGGDGVGWRLVIENPLDPIRTINFRDKGNVKTINPKQSVIVVSASARSFGSDHLPSATVFPDTRVFNVYKELKGHFEMTSRTSSIINPTAFNIKLIDGGKKVNDVVMYTTSDEIGNLDGNARTSDEGMWDYPESITEDGYRSSLIRIFDDGTPREGISMMESDVKPLGGTAGEGVDGMPGIDSKYSWVHAADTDFVDIFVRHTWYGSENDFGTPANRAAQVTPVNLSFFRPALENGEVVIRWTTESELDNAGFNILRSEERNGEYKQVNTELIAGHGTTGERHSYKWVDPTAKPGVVYYYQIEDVSFAGEHQVLALTKLKGLISAKNKLTTRWGELKSQD